MAIEAVTEAIVLDKEDSGEADSRIFLYTKDFGKVIAKATGIRKIVSKLASHLEPLDYLNVRLVSKADNISEGRGLQITDALLIESKKGHNSGNEENFRNALKTSYFISRAVPNGAPDNDLWNFLHKIRIEGVKSSIQETLEFLGFGASFASCELCSKSAPEYFYSKNNMFVCQSCMFTTPIIKEDLFKI